MKEKISILWSKTLELFDSPVWALALSECQAAESLNVWQKEELLAIHYNDHMYKLIIICLNYLAMSGCVCVGGGGGLSKCHL